MIEEYVKVLLERGIKLSYADKAIELLAEKSMNGKSGARDLRNLIRKEVEDKLSLAIIKNDGFNIGSIHLTGGSNLELIINKNS